MKTYKEIISDMIKTFVDQQSKVTYFGKDSVARALFSAIALTIAELWNDLYQIKRKIFVDTAEGIDLDELGARRGKTRKTASQSSVVLVFAGTSGTIIPKDTQVRNKNTGVVYQTAEQITISSYSMFNNAELSNTVIAESINTGINTKSKASEVTVLVNPILGVTSVTNPYSSTGGDDMESDSDFRYRIINSVNILAQGTKAYYETIAKENNGILAKAFSNPLVMGVDVYVLKNDLAPYTATELNNMKTVIEENQRALYPVNVYNAMQKNISIYCKYIRDINYSSEDVINNVNIGLTQLSDPRINGFGSVIKYADMLKVIINTTGVKEILVESLAVNNVKDDVVCGTYEIPRIISLTLLDQYESIVQQDIEYLFTE